MYKSHVPRALAFHNIMYNEEIIQMLIEFSKSIAISRYTFGKINGLIAVNDSSHERKIIVVQVMILDS